MSTKVNLYNKDTGVKSQEKLHTSTHYLKELKNKRILSEIKRN